jgi:hypothetical protein
MTRVLLCAGPALLVVRKDGLLFFRRPGQPDLLVPYAPENYPIFLRSARAKYDLTSVVGRHGEEEPVLAEEVTIPGLRQETLPTGESVYRVIQAPPEPCRANHSASARDTPVKVLTFERQLASADTVLPIHWLQNNEFPHLWVDYEQAIGAAQRIADLNPDGHYSIGILEADWGTHARGCLVVANLNHPMNQSFAVSTESVYSNPGYQVAESDQVPTV